MTRLTTPSGPLHGSRLEIDGTTVHRFLGIPYAAPPSGKNRFRAPVPADPWTAELDCTVPGPAAPQNPESAAPPGLQPRAWSEDGCLNLNIWTPGTGGPGRPVMVWIHGGAYLSGANSDGMYDGARLAAAAGVVLVSVNYRLGALGFLHLADLLGAGYEDSGNLGLLDQVEALRWVRRNIDAFGGDPGNVTVFGESAGAAAIGTLLGMPASEGLFRRAIMQSGTAERYRQPEGSARISAGFLELCGLDESSARELTALPMERLLAAQAALEKRLATETFAVPLPFQPTVGTPSLPVPPLESILAGLNSRVDLLAGTNLNEGSFAVQMRPPAASDPDYPARAAAVLAGAGVPPGDASGYTQALARVLSREPAGKELLEAAIADSVYRQPTNRLLAARQLAAQNSTGRTLAYLFTWRSPAMGGKLGACHALEIPFVFRHLDAPEAAFLTRGQAPAALGDTISDAWAAFAGTGTPVAAGTAWPEYGEARSTLVLGDETRLEDDPRRELREFFEAVRPLPAR
ncbi:carboxylesterase/lipase family protein [Pseudarthrobacter sp. C4D7]|uniref:carboxylesterase/lipase family protein n=1 Tax=Pseudarthrobacter sp. C4D7 TaxID=2735268 RepID=UPI0015846561|nr:carboxylesterase/lipase family protein [Pseudarthrobacter sp. C4D7]NUT71386.1 carboxylesterase/lipase family protein [Pseudarthrobacter sp. C4D7]